MNSRETKENSEIVVEKRVSFYNVVFKKFFKHKPGLVGLSILLITVLCAIFADYIVPHNPYKFDVNNIFQPPSLKYFMGTDSLGQDIFSRIIYGARYSILIAVCVSTISMIIGVTLGLLSGYYGGIFDDIVTRATDAFMAIPSFFLYIIALAMFDLRGIMVIISIMGLLFWPTYAKVVRSEVLSYKERPFIEAGRSMGASDFRIMTRYILPNLLGTLAVLVSFRMATAILTETGLSFIGLGDPTLCSWGSMLARAHSSGAQLQYWWAPTFPGIAISVLTWAFNLVGDGLRDSLDVKVGDN